MWWMPFDGYWGAKPTELRLERMTDVIFNGSKRRKPGGIAQVSLTFDNTKNLLGTEYQQVTIARLLYRSGESEYRINGTLCRLRDIHSLFMDTVSGPIVCDHCPRYGR